MSLQQAAAEAGNVSLVSPRQGFLLLVMHINLGALEDKGERLWLQVYAN